MQLDAHGISVDVPRGWDAHIYRRPMPTAGAALNALGQIGEEATRHVVAHISTFPLPEDRGDYGGGAVERMGPADALIVLFEYHEDSTKTALFAATGVPWPLDPGQFDAQQMQRPLPGQGGLQRFFQVDGRAFCLYVALGALANRAALVENVNDVLSTIDISSL